MDAQGHASTVALYTIDENLKNIISQHHDTTVFIRLEHEENRVSKVYDAIVVDIDLFDGVKELTFMPLLRRLSPFSPIILMTGSEQLDLTSDVLAQWADDYVLKPINSAWLSMRLAVRIAEFKKRDRSDKFKVGDVHVDSVARTVSCDGIQKSLSPTEMNLLKCLVSARGSVVERDVMKRRCWGRENVTDNALNRKLHEVRRVLENISGQVIVKTIYGTGFVLEVRNN